MGAGLIWGSLGIYLVSVLLLAGLLTNWFRYSPSLQDALVLKPLVVISLVVVAVHLIAVFFRKGSLLIRMAPLTATLVAMGILSFFMYTVQGRFLPSWQTAHLERNGFQYLKSEGGEISYYLELKNPFANSHREHLVITRHGREIRIRLPLFGEPKGGYPSPNRPADWCTLEKTEDPDIYLLHTAPALRKASFQINLAEQKAKEVKPTQEVPGRSRS